MAGVALAVLAGWVSWVLMLRGASPEPPPASPPGGSGNTLGYAGAGSCSARACHGGGDPTEAQKKSIAQQNESTICAAYDKHTSAYRVLLGPRAKKMAENLAAAGLTTDGKPFAADKDERCLACHTTPEFASDKTPAAAKELRGGGVSCEACHGPASKEPSPWLVEHTSPKKWREKLSAKEKAKYHFTELDNPAVLTETCAGCHVGAPPDAKKGIPARDCNHDIMAAGHPRLNFELCVFLANMPPHWNVELKRSQRKAQGKDPGEFVARLWAIGQLASAGSSLDLLHYRADQAAKAGDKNPRWPEFAEYRCFACHADLNPNWKDRVLDTGRPGAIPYDPWYRTLVPVVPGPPDPDQIAANYKQLEAEMNKPWPDPAKVRDIAKALREQQKAWLAAAGKEKYDAADLLKKVLARVDKLPNTWERATQFTLAAAILKYGDLLKKPGATTADLKALEEFAKALTFPEKSESPAGIAGPFPKREGPVAKGFATLLKELGPK
jgi:hypothetical protein